VSPRLVVVFVAALLVVAGSAVPASAVMVPAPAAAADPSVVPQTITHLGEPGYNIVPVSQFHPTSTGTNPQRPSFRGGKHSMVVGSTGTAPPTRRSTSIPSAPKINVAYGTFNRTGLTAATTQLSTPPDSTGAMGINHYLEMANSSIAAYDRNNNLNRVGIAEFWAFAGFTGATPFCDPQIQWDPSSGRWIFLFLYCGAGTQGFVLGWSKTANPIPLDNTNWCPFVVTTGSLLFDFPKLGHNSNFMILGGNFFANPTSNNPSFTSSQVAWVPTPALGDPTPTCPLPTFTGTNFSPMKNGDGVTNTFTPVPVNTDNTAANGYILSAYDASGSNGQPGGPRSKVSVWHLDAAGVLHTDSDVTVNSYTPPTSAPQPGTSFVLDTLPGMFTQAVGDPATGIWAQHTVAGQGGRSQVDWYEFTASGVNLALTQQGTISSPTDWVFNAAISPRFDALGAAIVYNRSSPNLNPVIASQIRYSTTAPGTWAAGELILATSPAADTDRSCNVPAGAPCRWGDYAGATPDPFVQNLVWGTSEFNTASGFNSAWSDEIFAIVPTPEAPNTVRAYAGRQSSARVSWTPGAYDPLCGTPTYSVFAYQAGPNPVSQAAVTPPATSIDYPGLTFNTTYTFTVIATCSSGPSLESAHSNAVKIGDPSTQSAPRPAPTPSTRFGDPIQTGNTPPGGVR